MSLDAPDIAGRDLLREPPLPMSATFQQGLFDAYLERATERVIEQLTDPCLVRVVQRIARSRMLAGVDTFGDRVWKKNPDALMVEMIEELADAIVYAAARAYAQRGGPGV